MINFNLNHHILIYQYFNNVHMYINLNQFFLKIKIFNPYNYISNYSILS